MRLRVSGRYFLPRESGIGRGARTPGRPGWARARRTLALSWTGQRRSDPPPDLPALSVCALPSLCIDARTT
eukprot:334973-Alexandrium_andersonii.AAC.1